MVLKEGRHLTEQEAEAAKKGVQASSHQSYLLKEHDSTDAPTTLAGPSNGKAARKDASLRFSSANGKANGNSKRKIRTYDEDEDGNGANESAENVQESFDDIAKRARVDADSLTAASKAEVDRRNAEKKSESQKKVEMVPAQKTGPLSKEEKADKKAKRKAAKKMLSFTD